MSGLGGSEPRAKKRWPGAWADSGKDGACSTAVPVGEKGSDIDHVVMGPSGVFTLNTKNHIRSNVWVTENVFMVNGRKTDYFRNSRHEAALCLKAA